MGSPGSDPRPRQFLVVFASGRARWPGTPSTNFRLSAGGEYLALVSPVGLIATQFSPTFPSQTADVSYGYESDLVTLAFFDPLTGRGQRRRGGGVPLDPVPSLAPPDSSPDRLFWGCNTPHGRPPLHPGRTGTHQPGPRLRVPRSSPRRRRSGPAPSGVTPSLPRLLGLWIFQGLVENGMTTALGRASPRVDRPGRHQLEPRRQPPRRLVRLDDLVTPPTPPSRCSRPSTRSPPSPSRCTPTTCSGSWPRRVSWDHANSTEEGAWERPCSLEWLDPNSGLRFQIDCGVSIKGERTPARSSAASSPWRSSSSRVRPLQARAQGVRGLPRWRLRLPRPRLREPTLHQRTRQFDHEDPRPGDPRPVRGLIPRDMDHPRPMAAGCTSTSTASTGCAAPPRAPGRAFAAGYGGGTPRNTTGSSAATSWRGTTTPWGARRPPLEGGARHRRHRCRAGPAVAGRGRVPGAGRSGRPRELRRLHADELVRGQHGLAPNNWMATARATRPTPQTSTPTAASGPTTGTGATLYWGGAVTTVNDGFWDRTGQSGRPDNVNFIPAALAHPDYRVLLADRAQLHLLTPGGSLWVEPGFDVIGTPCDPSFPERNVPATRYHDIATELGPAVLMDARAGATTSRPRAVQPHRLV